MCLFVQLDQWKKRGIVMNSIKHRLSKAGLLFDVCLFVQLNQWKKRGITMNGIKHGLFWAGTGFPAQVSIFACDGTVVVSQGGVEMGQGLYTKVRLL